MLENSERKNLNFPFARQVGVWRTEVQLHSFLTSALDRG